MPIFQSFYEMKLKTSFLKVLAFWSQWRYYDVFISYWHDSGSGSLPSLIPTFCNIGILHYKQAKLRKYIQHSVIKLPCISKDRKVLQQAQVSMYFWQFIQTVRAMNFKIIWAIFIKHMYSNFIKIMPALPLAGLVQKNVLLGS